MKAQVLQKIRASAPWEKEVYVMPGDLVDAIPANNLPEDAEIKYWLHPLPGSNCDWAPWADGPYGIGAYAGDVELL